MALEFNIDMADSSTVNNIIYGNNNRTEKVRGCSLTPNKTRSRSISPSIESDSRDKSYPDKVQCKSDNMIEDDPVVMSDSPQLEYTTPSKTNTWCQQGSWHNPQHEAKVWTKCCTYP